MFQILWINLRIPSLVMSTHPIQYVLYHTSSFTFFEETYQTLCLRFYWLNIPNLDFTDWFKDSHYWKCQHIWSNMFPSLQQQLVPLSNQVFMFFALKKSLSTKYSIIFIYHQYMFPSTLNTLSLMENCEKCVFLLQVTCGSGAI